MITYLDVLKQYYKENMFDYLAERKKYLEKSLEVLVEEEKNGEYFGYSQNYLRVKFRSDEKNLVNKLINVKIKCVKNDILIAEKEM